MNTEPMQIKLRRFSSHFLTRTLSHAIRILSISSSCFPANFSIVFIFVSNKSREVLTLPSTVQVYMSILALGFDLQGVAQGRPISSYCFSPLVHSVAILPVHREPLQWRLEPLKDYQTVLVSLKLNFASGLIIYMMDN